ncbi:MAG TPA: hypothetical protein VFH80_24675 [Solirubrobacteraceae bacterium]|nr:hypothetical protein [Solirubrobacteraceae bacterium]
MMIGTLRGTSIGAALAAAALACGVAACGGSSSSSSATDAAAPATSSAATGAASTSAASTTTSASSSGGTTAPGAKLAIGQSAKVAFTPAGSTDKSKASTLQVTVQSFDKGSLSDFNGIQLDANEKASTPVYVKVHVTNLGPANIDVDSSAAAIEGVDNTGNNQSSVTFIGDFPKCPDAASTKPIATGKGYDDCLTFLVPGGITKVSYNGTNDYIDSPVTWSPN